MTDPYETAELTPTAMAAALEREVAQFGITVTYGETGGGVQCIVATRGDEDALYFGTAEGFLGYSDYFGDINGSWPHFVDTDDQYEAWQKDEPVGDAPAILAAMLLQINEWAQG